MIYRLAYISLFICLCSSQGIQSEIVWSGKAKPGFSVIVDASRDTVPIDTKLQIQAIVLSPEGYHVNRALMRKNLLDDLGYGAPPFSLLAEEVVLQEHNIQRLIYTLDPQIPGEYALSFGKVVFETDDQQTDANVEFMAGTFPIKIVMEEGQLNDVPKPASLMDLSTVLPVNISEQNIEKYVDNPNILQEELEKHRKIFLSKGTSTIAFSFLLIIKLLIIFSAVWQMLKKKRVKAPQAVITLTAKEKASKALKQLRSDVLITSSKSENCHARLSEIVRVFLEEVSGVHASKMTSNELLSNTKHSKHFTKSQHKILSELLLDTDRFNFAKQKDSEKDIKRNFFNAERIIEQFLPDESIPSVSRGVAFWGLAALLKNYLKYRRPRN